MMYSRVLPYLLFLVALLVPSATVLSQNRVLDTLFSFKPPDGTVGIAFDGKDLWLGGEGSFVYQVSTAGNVIRKLAVPALNRPAGLTWDGEALWAVQEQTASLYRINTADGTALAVFGLPKSTSNDPNNWGVAWDGSNLWHSHYGYPDASSAVIYRLDPSDAEVLGSFVPPTKGILGVAWDGSALCALDMDHSRIYRIDGSTGTVIDTLEIPVLKPIGLAYDGSSFWCVSHSELGGDGRVYRLGSFASRVVPLPDVDRMNLTSWPNPCSGSTTIQFDLPAAGTVRLTLNDALGRELRTLLDERRDAGSHDVLVDVESLPSGAYLYRLETAGAHRTGVLVVAR